METILLVQIQFFQLLHLLVVVEVAHVQAQVVLEDQVEVVVDTQVVLALVAQVTHHPLVLLKETMAALDLDLPTLVVEAVEALVLLEVMHLEVQQEMVVME